MNELLKFAPLSSFLLAASLAVAGCGSSSSGGASGTGGSPGSGGASGTGGSSGSGGASGTGGSATDAGSGGSSGMDAAAEGGTDTPPAGPMAQATITKVGMGTVTGTVTFAT